MYDLNIILNYQIKTTKYKKISTIYYEKFEHTYNVLMCLQDEKRTI